MELMMEVSNTSNRCLTSNKHSVILICDLTPVSYGPGVLFCQVTIKMGQSSKDDCPFYDPPPLRMGQRWFTYYVAVVLRPKAANHFRKSSEQCYSSKYSGLPILVKPDTPVTTTLLEPLAQWMMSSSPVVSLPPTIPTWESLG